MESSGDLDPSSSNQHRSGKMSRDEKASLTYSQHRRSKPVRVSSPQVFIAKSLSLDEIRGTVANTERPAVTPRRHATRRSLDMDQAAREAKHQRESRVVAADPSGASGGRSTSVPSQRGRQTSFTFAVHSAEGLSAPSVSSLKQLPNQPPSPPDQIKAWRLASKNNGFPHYSLKEATVGGAKKAPRPPSSTSSKGLHENAFLTSPRFFEGRMKNVPSEELHGVALHADENEDLYPSDTPTNQSHAVYCLRPAAYLLLSAACCLLPLPAAVMTTPNVLAFEPDGRPIEFAVWLDDLQLFLLTDAKEGVSLFDYVSGTAVAPAADAPALERSQWQTRDAAARLAIRNHLPILERAHFSQHKTAKTLTSCRNEWFKYLLLPSTSVTPLPAPVPVSLSDPSGGPVLAQSSTVLPCPAVSSGELSGLHLPSFSMNLVSNAVLQDAGVDTFTPGRQRVAICTCSQTGRHLATFTRAPGSSLYTLTTASRSAPLSPQLHASAQVATLCECHRLSHDTLLWHHCLGHPSLPRLRSMHSRFLVSGLPRSLPALPPSPAPPCIPCVEGRQRATPHSSSFPPTEAPLQTPHLDVWGPARVSGQGHERYFLLVVDDYTRYTTLRERFQSDFPVLRLHSDRGGEFSSDLLAAFCVEHGIRQTFTLPASPQHNGVAERRIGLVMEVARTSMIHAAAPPFSVVVCVPVRRASTQPLAPCLLAGDLAHTAVDREGWQRVAFPGPAPLGVSQVDPPAPAPVEVTGDSGPAGSGAVPGGVELGGAESVGAERVEPGGAEPACEEPGGAASGGAASGGAASGGFRDCFYVVSLE
ncbi:unnamed protein product [Closterium sp. NIES-54]